MNNTLLKYEDDGEIYRIIYDGGSFWKDNHKAGRYELEIKDVYRLIERARYLGHITPGKKRWLEYKIAHKDYDFR